VNAHAYRWSKTVAEKAAWEHHGKTTGKFDVATILPPMVLGENKQQLTRVEDLNQSSLILFNLLAGNMKHVIPGYVGFVDVSDVAKARACGGRAQSGRPAIPLQRRHEDVATHCGDAAGDVPYCPAANNLP